MIEPGHGELIFNILIRVAIVLMLGLLILIWRKNRRAPSYEFRIGTMADGLNTWDVVNNEALEFNHGDYEVKPDALYKIRPGFRARLRWKLENVKGGFMIVFKKGTPQAIRYGKPSRSAETLLTIQESRALGQALKDEFRHALGGKTIFMVIAVVVVGVLVYYFYTGRIG